MPIIRERVTRNFTALANDVLRDPRLKGEEIGLLAWLLTHDPNWKIIIPVLMRKMGWGRDKTYGILNRLLEIGYIHRSQERDLQSGSFGEVIYTVYANPSSHPEHGNTRGVSDDPLPDLPLPVNPKASKERSKENQETPPTPSRALESGNGKSSAPNLCVTAAPAFDQFWEVYAPEPYMSRRSAERTWRRMSVRDRHQAYDGVRLYLVDCRTHDRRRVNVVRYLRDRNWEGYSKPTCSLFEVRPGTPQWHSWLKYYASTSALKHKVAFMEHQATRGKSWTVPTEWPSSDRSTGEEKSSLREAVSACGASNERLPSGDADGPFAEANSALGGGGGKSRRLKRSDR